MITLRPATSDDANTIADINVRSWRQAYRGIIPDSYLASLDPATIAKRWRDVVLSATDTVLIAEHPAVCGFSWMSRSRDTDARATTAEIIAIYVDPAFQRQGIGRALLLATVNNASTRGFETIMLWVLSENTAARAFYESCGFIVDGCTKTTTRWGGKPIQETRYSRSIPTTCEAGPTSHGS